MKVAIDADRCTGHGRCYDLSPEVFVDDEDGYGQVRTDVELTDGLGPAIRRAVTSCPEQAISVSPGPPTRAGD